MENGTIYFNETLNKWVAQFSVNGKRRAVYGITRAEVAQKLQKALVNIKENKFIDKSKVTVRELLDQIIEEQEKSNKITENTLARNIQTAKIIKEMYIADMQIQRVNAVQINDCLLSIVHYFNPYIEKIYMLLASVFNKAMLLQIINQNPFSIKGNIIKPRSSRQDKVVEAFTIEEHQKFLQQLEEKEYKHKIIFYVLIETGMRIRRSISIRTKLFRFQK